MYLSIFKPSQTPKYSAIWWMFLCFESAGFLSWNLFFASSKFVVLPFIEILPKLNWLLLERKKKWKVLSQKPNYTLFNQPSNQTRNRPILWSHSAVNADLRDFYSRTTTLPLFLQIWIDERLRSQYLSKLWSLEEICPGRAQLRAQLSDGVMEAEEGSIRWGENLRLAGRKNVSICASEP